MAPVTYARSAKRKRARLSTTSTPERATSIENDIRIVKKQRTVTTTSDEEIYDSEPERETSIAAEDLDPCFNSSSATQVGKDDEAVDEEKAGTTEGSQERSAILAENANLQIIGEADPADVSDCNDEEDTIPVRELYDFSIYNFKTRKLVTVGELAGLEYGLGPFGASGVVKPHKHCENDYDEDDLDDVLEEEEVDDDLDDDRNQNSEQYVELTEIKRFDIHHIPLIKGKMVLDSKMYIKTDYAWYILAEPSAKYRPMFVKFWLQHRMLHLVVKAALESSRITLEQFVVSLKVTENSPNSVAVARKMLGRDLNEDDLNSDDVRAYILSTLDDLREEGVRVHRVPLIRALLGDSSESCWSSSPVRPTLSRKKSSRASRNLEIEVLKHRNATVVTPIVNSIGEKLFNGLSAAGALDSDEPDDEVVGDDSLTHKGNPSSLCWVGRPDENGMYDQVLIDGLEYTVGDSVIVMPGEDEDKTRAANHISKKAQTKNTLGNKMWFCRICYMYEQSGKKLFHGQWYTHGSKMLLQEVAHPQSLFLMDSCEDGMDLAAIVQKCNVRNLALDETEPNANIESHENNFHTGFMLVNYDSSLVALSQIENEAALSVCENGKICLACGLRTQQRRLKEVSPLPPRGFSVRGVKYHGGEFIYLMSSHSPVYDIGQITKFRVMVKPPTVTIRLFGRFDDVIRRKRKKAEWHTVFETDERRLFQTNEILTLPMDHIDGKCFIRQLADPSEIDDWVKHTDHFYTSQWAESRDVKKPSQFQNLAPNDLTQCKDCMEEHIRELADAERLLQKNGPLRGLELFAGAGGLGTGFDLSGFVDTRWAIEFSPSAALTYQSNHPNTIVYNQCSNVMLQDALDVRDGKKRARPRDLHSGNALPLMPRREEVDVIFGGPPCQSFSGANHHKKADDIRSTLICNMISYVEFYRPMYFLLENVLGLLQFKLLSRMIGQAFDPSQGIEMGVLKFIVRSLTALGYQVRFKVCQAGQYGAPQGRKRVLFWGARRGCPLPEFPAPTHAFKGSFHHTLPDKTRLPPPSRSLDLENPHQIAPCHPVTITDSIGDLPPFDWINPRQIVSKKSAKDKTEDSERARILPSFNAVITSGYLTYPGYTHATEYPHPPLSRYQKAMRVHSKQVSYQYTTRFGAGIVERVTSVPLKPGAFHDDLPYQLRMVVTQRSKKERSYAGLYGRVDGEGSFKTAMTSVAPNRKGGDVLHPSQKRIMTVRECARAQGFPDHYQFLSDNTSLSKTVTDQHRQIGNAVPVPLAMALGRSLGDALLKMWKEQDRAGSPEV